MNLFHYYTDPVAGVSTEALLSLTGTKGGATVAATTTPAVVTGSTKMSILSFRACYIATAVSGYAILRLRYNPAGPVAINSPIIAELVVGCGAPTTPNATGSDEAPVDGIEVPTGGGIGISMATYAAGVLTAAGFVSASVTGGEF